MPLSREAKRKYDRDRYHRKRQEYLADKFCVECGTTENLQINHIDPSQKESHNIWSWSEPRRETELKKCNVLCKSCHLEHHLADGTFINYNGSKINEDQVREIKKRIAAGNETFKAISEDYPVSHHMIGKIAAGKHWSHIEL